MRGGPAPWEKGLSLPAWEWRGGTLCALLLLSCRVVRPGDPMDGRPQAPLSPTLLAPLKLWSLETPLQ